MPDLPDELEALKAQIAALTARIYILEQRLGVSQAPREAALPRVPVAAKPEPPKPPSTTPPPQPSVPSFATLSSSRPSKDTSLEKRIGQYWLNRIGIVAVLIGVSYFLKWAFDNNLIGPTGRVLIGILAGIGLILWSEYFRTRKHAPFSYSLKAVGIGTLYLSLWAAAQFFDPPLISASMAFAAMLAVTASTIVMALSQDAQLLAAFALVGGFMTPVLVSTHQNREIALFAYVGVLDLAVLAIAMVKPWRRLLWGSFFGTQLLYWGWYLEYYRSDSEQRLVTVLFVALFAVIFAVIPLATPFERSTRFKGPSITLIMVPLLNAVLSFVALLTLYSDEKTTLTWYALALAAAYLFLSNAFQRRVTQAEGKVINLIHVAIAIAFITVAIPLKLSHHWITMGWLVESAVLLWIAVRTRTSFLRYLAVAALALGILRLLVVPIYGVDMLVFNSRFATYAVAVAVLAGIVYFARRGSPAEQGFAKIAAVTLNVLALIALTWEAVDYFDRQARAYVFTGLNEDYQQFWLKREFAYSAVWLLYGAGLMAVGFWKKSAFVRWQGLVLIAATILKVFLYDSRYLNTGYRVLSFIALGVVLLGISFVYFRISSRTPDKSSPETPV